jgi:hypothetical protein
MNWGKRKGVLEGPQTEAHFAGRVLKGTDENEKEMR